MTLGLVLFIADLDWSCSRGAAPVRLAAANEVAAKSFENEGDIASIEQEETIDLRNTSSTCLWQRHSL